MADRYECSAPVSHPADWVTHDRAHSLHDWRPGLDDAEEDEPESERFEPARHVVGTDATKRPISDLGRKLLAIRERIVESGAPLLTMGEIEEEVAKRRGERR